jgi:mRNA-degrading endonuclease toxin of MazEF toxin-antitoxin module
MKPFEIYSWQPPGWPEPHPCVVVSHRDRADRKTPVEVVMCSSQRAKRLPGPTEILLDNADGLDWPTICKCDVIYAVSKGELTTRRGAVGQERAGQLVRTMIAAHGWGEVL